MSPLRLLIAAALPALLLFTGCKGSAGGFVAPCDRLSPPTGCGRTCDATRVCDTGLYCGNGTCKADCASAADCGSGLFCTTSGQCEAVSMTDGGGTLDGSTDSGSRDSAFDSAFDANANSDGSICADVTVQVTPVTPNVTVIVDRSGSMIAGFPSNGDPNRWDAVKSALIDPSTGLITNLESQVRFGLVMYTATSDDNDDNNDGQNEITSPDCPWLEINPGEIVDPDLNNYNAIRTVYEPAGFPGNGDTPTGDSVDRVIDRVIGQSDPDPNPNIFIIATDGLPDRCEDPDPNTTRGRRLAEGEAITAVERAFGEGIRTFMIWVGDLGSDNVRDHVQEMANAGVGSSSTDPDAPFYVAGDDSGLRTALTTIVNGELSCDVALNGRLSVEKACTGTVRLNGNTLTCMDANGWDVVDETTIRLQGTACDEFKTTTNASLEASFPCDTVILI